MVIIDAIKSIALKSVPFDTCMLVMLVFWGYAILFYLCGLLIPGSACLVGCSVGCLYICHRMLSFKEDLRMFIFGYLSSAVQIFALSAFVFGN